MNRLEFIQKLADQDVYTIGDKKFNYHKITNAQFNELEQMKLDMRLIESPEEVTKRMDQILRKSAEIYFGITTEYDELPREDLGYALEAATHRSVYGKPFLEKSSSNSLPPAAASSTSPATQATPSNSTPT